MGVLLSQLYLTDQDLALFCLSYLLMTLYDFKVHRNNDCPLLLSSGGFAEV